MSASNLSALPGTAYRLVEDALESKGYTRSKDGKSWTCPAHDDHDPSLSVKQGDKGLLSSRRSREARWR